MPPYKRYTSFAPGELDRCLDALAERRAPDRSVSVPVRSGRLLKALTVPVRFPDGTEGRCEYERRGPTWHVFAYTDRDGLSLPRQVWPHRLDNTPAAITDKACALAESAYTSAIEAERQGFFQRATLPADGTRTVDPGGYQMTTAKARRLAGQYALCTRVGIRLLPVGPLRKTLAEANADWQARADPKLVVGGCSRLDRAFRLPRYNPLYAVSDPRPAPTPSGPGAEEGVAKGEDT